MASRRWFLSLFGAGLNVCLLSGCIAPADRTDSFLVSDPVLHTEIAASADPKAADPVPETRAAEPPPPPPMPEPEPPPQKSYDPPPVVAAPSQPAPPPSDPPAVAALRAYLENKPGSAATVLQQLLPVLASASLSEIDRGPKSADTVKERLDLLAETLQPRRLTLSKVCFTRGIEGFGVYDPLPATEAGPVYQSGLDGRPGERVQLYVEVRNFASRKAGAVYETALATRLEIRDPAGKLVEFRGIKGDLVQRLDRPARPDRSLSPRQDYYLPVQFHVPPRLPAGRYDLWIEVCDEVGSTAGARRVDSRILPFRVEPPR